MSTVMTVQQAFARAFAHEAAGRWREARTIYEQILAAIPEHPGALLKIAADEARNERFEIAQQLLERAVRAAEEQSLPAQEIWLALGHVHVARADRPAARRAFEQARALGHPAPDAHRFLAWLALEDGDARRAQAVCREGLQAFPGDAELLHLSGKAYKAAGAAAAARAVLLEALAASNDDAAILVTLGAACIDAGLPGEAPGYLQRAIERGQDTAQAWDNLGVALTNLGQPSEALRAYERAVMLDPKLMPALSNLIIALRSLCRWDDARVREEAWIAVADDGGDRAGRNPFVALALPTTSAQQLAIARGWSRATLPSIMSPRPIRQRGTQLRIGYLSADFRAHATSWLMAGLFERHDRRRFSVHAYSYGPDDASPMRARIKGAFEHWTEVGAMSDEQCAERIIADRIDVLVELKGHTAGARLGMLARRPAPVQLHYLGYPGTLGFDGIDGIVADANVVPPPSERDYHERVWRLPRCYQVNDDRRALPRATPRATLGLADDALVLACFNQSYKLTRAFFETWMQALAQVPNAVLWLYAPNRIAQDNLCAEAMRSGVKASRLRFASPVPHDEHIARLRCADLVLDILPYGSHTTGSDALWAGVPLLTCRGATFAGAVGASLLDAVGLAELVTDSLEAYAAMLLDLAQDRDRLRAYRSYLDRERQRLSLFDTAGFARDFETLLCVAYDETSA